MRGFGLALLGVFILGFTGCGTDNESEASKLSTGTPPAGAEGSTPPPSSPTTLEEYARQRKQNTYEGTKLDKSAKKKQ